MRNFWQGGAALAELGSDPESDDDAAEEEPAIEPAAPALLRSPRRGSVADACFEAMESVEEMEEETDEERVQASEIEI